MVGTNYSMGFEVDPAKLKANNQDHTKWTNPLEVELPRAPNLKIYCLYGHGKETERSYWYAKGEYLSNGVNAEGDAMPVRHPTPLLYHLFSCQRSQRSDRSHQPTVSSVMAANQIDRPQGDGNTNGTTPINPLDFPLDRDLWIDSAVTVPSSIPPVRPSPYLSHSSLYVLH